MSCLGVDSSFLEVLLDPTRIQFLPGTLFRRSFIAELLRQADMAIGQPKLMGVLQEWEEAGNLMDRRYYHAVATISLHSLDNFCQFGLKDSGL